VNKDFYILANVFFSDLVAARGEATPSIARGKNIRRHFMCRYVLAYLPAPCCPFLLVSSSYFFLAAIRLNPVVRFSS